MSTDFTTHRRTSSRQTSLSSPLEHAPKFSPPTSTSRPASPVRKPLHERSNSQTNQYSGPTIRIVEDPGSDIYSKYPVPSQASQILPPPRHAPGYGFERPGPRVSSGSKVASTVAKFEASKTRVLPPPPPLQLARKKKVRHSVSTSASDADTLVASSYTPSSLRFSQGSTPPSSPSPDDTEFEKGLEILKEESSQPPQKSTIRAVPPSSSGGESLDTARALTPKASAASFASTIPATSQPTNSNTGNSTSVNHSSRKGHKHTPSSWSEKGHSGSDTDANRPQPVLRPQTSQASFAFSDISYASIEPTHPFASSQPSPTLHEARTATFASGVPVTYPLVRAASSSSSRAESEYIPSFASRMQDRSLVHQWSSQLSTIPSVSERDSRSLARNSRSYTRSQSQESYNDNGSRDGRTNIPRRRGHTIGSAQTSTDNVSEVHTESSAVPLPLFSPVSYGAVEEKDQHEEHMDKISPLPTNLPLRSKKSGHLRRYDSTSDSGSNPGSRPGSAQSDISVFVQNTIPAWARVYYRRGERVSMGAPGSESSESLRLPTSYSGRTSTPSDGHFPLSIYRPRNRPRNRASNADTVSLADDVHSIDGGVYALGPNMHPISGWSTPHLRTDRRSGLRYSVWKAPSLDSDLHTTLFGRQNRQVLLFCIGFIFPFAWMIASCLPLPLDPRLLDAGSHTDVEQQFARNFGALDDKAFQKATWWRNLNRIMSGVGTLLIGVIIALAILVTRMS